MPDDDISTGDVSVQPSGATAEVNPADSPSQQAEPQYVIDDSPEPGPTADGQAPPHADAQPAQAPAPDYQAVLHRAEAAERRAHEMMSRMQPFVERLLSPAQPAVDPRVLFEKLKSGEGTPQDLAMYLQTQQQQLVSELSYAAEQRALSASSEQTARGRFSKEQMGEGRDFDTLRQGYLAEAYQQNPQLRQMLYAAAPNDPAFSEYVFAVMSRVIERVGNDPIRGLKAVLDAVDSTTGARAANDVVRNINQAAKKGAQRVLAGARPVGGPVRRIGADDIWKMSDKEFAEFENQHGAKI